MHSFSIVFLFLSFFSLYVLCQQSPIPSIYHFFTILPPLFLGLLMQSPIAISFFLASMSPPLSVHLLSVSLLYMTSPCTPHQFLLGSLLHSNLRSHFITFLLSAFLTPTIILIRLFFANLDLLLFSAIVSSASMYADVTHQLSMLPLRLRDMRLSPITLSTFPQALTLAVTLIITKAINLVDFVLGKCHFLS